VKPKLSVARRAVRASTCLLVTTLAIAPGGALAAKGPSDPSQRGVAPVAESDWWFEAMKLGPAQKQTRGEGARIALLEGTLDPTVPELREKQISRGPSCSATKGAEFHRLADGRSDANAEHGTGMATLLAGSGNGTDNGRGVRGIAPAASLTLFGREEEIGSGWGHCLGFMGYSHLVEEAIKTDMHVMNMSFVGRTTQSDIAPLLDAGVVVVAAMPLESDTVHTPAAIPGVVAVTAIDKRGHEWNMAETSSSVVVAAPGVAVGTGGIVDGAWRSDAWTDGTSIAAAITSGALALVKSKYPKSTGNQLIQHLIHYTGRYPDQEYRHYGDTGFGIVSVANMLKSSPTQWPDENPLSKGPAAAERNYPMWASSLIDAPAEANDKWAKAEREATQNDGKDVEPAEASNGSGLPTWALPLAGVLVVGGAVGALLFLRRKNPGV
jgi:subtilisin family serine protease